MNKNEKFIEKARKIHKNKYDYSKVEYVNTSTKVCIICDKVFYDKFELLLEINKLEKK